MAKQPREFSSTGVLKNDLPYSSSGHRVISSLFDLSFLILGTVVIMIPSLLVFVSAMKGPSASKTGAVYLVMFFTGALVAVFDIVYRVAFPYFFKGETLGGRFFKMRLLDESGSEITLKSLLIRALVSLFLVIFTFGFYYVIETVSVLVSVSHRSFVDVISHSVVVDELDSDF